MNDDLFEKLEKLNAQIDIWIDEEDYDSVDKHLVPSDEARRQIDELFPDDTRCTNEMDQAWRSALHAPAERSELHFQKVMLPDSKDEHVQLDKSSGVHAAWDILLWAKLLRAKIQQKGSDCYYRRLDDVLTFLESNLPRPEVNDTPDAERERQIAKLTVFYLLELAQASAPNEGLGFSGRAERMICTSPHLKMERSFRFFYGLLASYNMGIAYFHDARYRQAVLQFNRIIHDAETMPRGCEEMEFFQERLGVPLIYLPSVLLRAEIQLKIQLAYHALNTLHKRLWERDKFPHQQEVSTHKQIRAKLIEIEAYQQMEDLGESWRRLREVYEKLLSAASVRGSLKLPEVTPTHVWQNLSGRFLGLLVDHHLSRLDGHLSKLQPIAIGQTESKPFAQTRYIRHGLGYLGRLRSAFSTTYFTAAKCTKSDRQRYFEQIARLFGWLARAQSAINQTRKNEEDVSTALSRLGAGLFMDRGRELLPPANDETTVQEQLRDRICPVCSATNVDLEDLDPDQYEFFKECMVRFFEHYCASGHRDARDLQSERERLIKGLIRAEMKSRGDLRIRDLELRYALPQSVQELDREYSGCEHCLAGGYADRVRKERAFGNLLACARSYNQCEGPGGHSAEQLQKCDYEKVMDDWYVHFFDPLKSRSTHKVRGSEFPGVSLHFVGLQRWNSTSPAQGRSIGGGYLLYRTDKHGRVDLGVAIDPGFDFVRNLLKMGFSLADIDIVLMSHSHADHVRDLESIVLLLWEVSKRTRRRRRIHVILTLGAYHRLKYIIEDPDFRLFIEPYVVDIEKEIDPKYFEHLPGAENEHRLVFFQSANAGSPTQFRAVLPPMVTRNGIPDVAIYPTRAYHDDRSRYSDSFGFKIELFAENHKRFNFGYTGDTKWVYPKIADPLSRDPERVIRDVAPQYSDCDAVLVHLGSLIDRDRDKGKHLFDRYEPEDGKGLSCMRLVREKNHLYLPGMLRLLSSLSVDSGKGTPLILISEFGEELRGGVRVDLIERLKRAYGPRLNFLPVDVGVNVRLWRGVRTGSIADQGGPAVPRNGEDPTVLCVMCEEYVTPNRATFERYGVDEGLFCVCSTCRHGTPADVLQDRLRCIYERGRELST